MDTLSAFESRIRGDRTVDPYRLYREINAGIAARDPRYLGRPLQWSTAMLDRWYKDLTGGSRTVSSKSSSQSSPSESAEGTTLYDLLQKAAILMETDLWFYEGTNQSAFKTYLFTSLRPLLYKSSSLDPQTLSALNTFLRSSRPYIPEDFVISWSNKLRNSIGIFPHIASHSV